MLFAQRSILPLLQVPCSSRKESFLCSLYDAGCRKCYNTSESFPAWSLDNTIINRGIQESGATIDFLCLLFFECRMTIKTGLGESLVTNNFITIGASGV